MDGGIYLLGIKSLKSKKFRESMDIFFVEGERFVGEIPENYEVLQYVLSDRYKKPSQKFSARAKIQIVPDGVFSRLAETTTPQGIIAVVKKNHYTISDILDEKGFILVLENVSDPANVGSLIRTASAANTGGVILTEGSASVWNPKVQRASAGSSLKIKIAQAPIGAVITQLKKLHIPLYAAHPTGDTLPYTINLSKRFALVVGSEAHGISQTMKTEADKLIKLPMNKDIESLSASVAGAVIMYEAVRQQTLIP